MALADLYVLDMIGSFRGEPLHNIFTYDSGGTGTAVDLVNAFVDDVLPQIQVLQTSELITESIYAYSLGNLGDLWEERIGTGGGDNVNDMLPVHDALNFTLKPTSRAVRPGSKRISGIPESVQVAGYITSSTYIAEMETMRTILGNPISDDDLVYFDPVIIKRVKYEVPNTDPVRFAYRFPEIGETPVYATLRTVLLNTKVSHQVSRGN